MNLYAKIVLVSFLVAAAVLGSCCARKDIHQTKALERNNTLINAFSVELFKQLATDSKANVFLSPVSIAQALSMTLAGADGNTAKEMHQVLQLPDDPMRAALLFQDITKSLTQTGDGASVMISNAIWLQQGFPVLASFQDHIQNGYNAQLESLDFQSSLSRENSRVHINTWTSDRTKGRIMELIPQGALTEQTRLVLTNAIFFSATWQHAFDSQMNIELPFVNLVGGKNQRTFMNQADTFWFAKFEGLSILELPYSEEKLVMTILLPDAWDGIHSLEKELSSQRLHVWLSGLERKKVDVYLPRWKVSYEMDAGQVLIDMGIKEAFTMEADFSKITGRKDLYISKILHKAFVEVTEKGTEAAAASAVIMAEKSSELPTEQLYFRADHPFIYIIRDRVSGAILFMGRLADPIHS